MGKIGRSILRLGIRSLVVAAITASTWAQAQNTNCAAFDPARNSSFLPPASEWTNSGAWQLSGVASGGMQYTNDSVTGTLSQTVYGVAPSSAINVSMSWGNGVVGTTPDGNQVKLDFEYDGVVYATFYTSAYSGGAVSGNGPTSGASFAAQNGATISPAFGPGNWGTVFATATYTITMPAGIPSTGTLLVRAARFQTNSPATDDIYLNSVSVDTASVCLLKVSQGGTGAFGFTTTGLDTDLITAGTQTTANITTTSVNTAAAFDAATTVYSGAQPMMRTGAGGFTITESSLPAGYLLSAVGCDAGTVSRSGNTLTVSGLASLQDTTCTFTNALQPQLRLQKALPDGRVAAADQFTLTIAGTGGPAAVTTTGSGTTATGVATIAAATIGNSYTLSEALVSGGGGSVLADYTSTYACTNTRSGGQAPSSNGSSITLTPVAGDNLTCTFSNAAVPRADLSIVKTPATATAATGTVVNYTIAASNAGPSAANGATVRDTPGVGLDCTSPGPTATCTASGGAACPSATVPVASLLGTAGVTIPTLPVGGGITITLQCLVTASGTP